jgi:hypothetical protein
MKYNTTFFVESVIPDLVKHVCQESLRKTLRGICVHLDNTPPCNSRKSEPVLTATKSRRIPAPVYSPDLSPSDFFCPVIKERMSRTSYSSPDELISAIGELIASLQKDQLAGIDKTWMKRFNWVIKHRGSTSARE